MLVQREMESQLAPLASITPVSLSEFAHPTQRRLAEAAANETATGFKKEIRMVGPIQHGARWAPEVDCVLSVSHAGLKTV